MPTPPFETALFIDMGANTENILVANSIQYLTIIGCSVANKLNTPISANVIYNDGTTDAYIAANIEIPVGSTFVPIGGDQKLVLTPSDTLKASSNATNGADVVVSYLNQVSS